MNKNNLIYKYAECLYELSFKQNLVKEYLSEVERIYNENVNDDLIRYLSNYFYTFEQKKKIINIVFKSQYEYVTTFFELLVKNNDFLKINKIISQYRLLVYAYINRSSGIVYSTIQLNEKTMQKLEKAFSVKLKKDVSLKNIVDESIIGGIKVCIDNKIYDRTLLSQVEKIKENLIKEITYDRTK